MELWEILVPTQMDNLSKTKVKPIRTRHHREWDKFVRGVSGGLTVLTPVKGQWISHSITEKLYAGTPSRTVPTLFEERMIPVRIACSREDIGKIIQFTLTHYRQQAVMCYRLSDEVMIVQNENSSPQCSADNV